MDPSGIGRKLKELYPQYANVDEVMLGQKYMQKYGGAVSGVQSGQIKITDIPEAQRVGVSVGLQGVGYEPPEKNTKTADQIKKENALATSDRIITQLEDLYFGTQGEKGDLSKGRLGGLLAIGSEKVGMNEALRTYKTTKASIRPMLVRAMGDVGALSEAEQRAAVKQLPTEFSTPEEALKAFSAMRQKLGLQQRDVSQIAGPSKNQLQMTFPAITGAVESAQETPWEAKDIAPQAMGPFGGLLMSDRYRKEIAPAGLEAASTYALLSGALGLAKKATGGLGAKAILNPRSAIAQARNKSAEGLEYNKQKVISAASEALKSNPAASKEFAQISQQVANAKDAKGLVKLIDKWNKLTYTGGGTIKGTKLAAFYSDFIPAARSELQAVAPKAAQLQNILKLTHTVPKAISTGAFQALKASALGRLLGMGV